MRSLFICTMRREERKSCERGCSPGFSHPSNPQDVFITTEDQHTTDFEHSSLALPEHTAWTASWDSAHFGETAQPDTPQHYRHRDVWLSQSLSSDSMGEATGETMGHSSEVLSERLGAFEPRTTGTPSSTHSSGRSSVGNDRRRVHDWRACSPQYGLHPCLLPQTPTSLCPYGPHHHLSTSLSPHAPFHRLRTTPVHRFLRYGGSSSKTVALSCAPLSFATITPRRVMGGSIEKVASEQLDEEVDEGDYPCSPLLKASQENGLLPVHRLPLLGEARETATTVGRSPVVPADDLFGGLRARLSHQHSCDNPAKRRRVVLKRKVEEESDPFATNGGAQDADAASILIALGHGSDNSRGVGDGDGNDKETSTVLNGLRIFPPDIPILSAVFPRLYMRYRVPSTLPKDLHAAIFGKDGLTFDGPLQTLAERGSKTLGRWNEPSSPLDLYTPRWVRGAGDNKEGMCTICYEQTPSEARFWRTKTSQYNYHLINQHGISPHTHRPFDPPIGFRDRIVKNASTGQRKIMIQAQCHACKKFIDMQSSRLGTVKVPEIYWWKHANVCHRGKPAIDATDGIFVEDQVSASTVGI